MPGSCCRRNTAVKPPKHSGRQQAHAVTHAGQQETGAPGHEIPLLPCDQKSVLLGVMPEVSETLAVTHAASENVARDCARESSAHLP